MTRILEPEWFSDDPAVMAEVYREHVAGRYHSNWDQMRFAASSCYLGAGQQFGNFLAGWERMTTKDQPRAEAALLLEINYKSFVFGPLLSTILMSTVALESFLRLCAEVALFHQTHGATALRLAVAGFDARPQHERLQAAMELCGADKLSADIERDARALVSFRNACLHDSPVFFLEDGRAIQIKRAQFKSADGEHPFERLYPSLHEATMSLTIEHARRAVRAHDSVVAHVATGATSEFKFHLNKLVSGLHISGIRTRIWVHDFDDKIDGQIKLWRDSVKPWREEIPMAEHEAAYRKMVRMSTMKVVKD